MMTMTGLRHKYLRDADAGTEEVLGDLVPEGERWYVEMVNVYNDTSADSDCLVSIKTHATKFPVAYIENIGAEEWTRSLLRFWMFPEERLVFDWTDLSQGDRLLMVPVGHRRYTD